MESVFVVAAVLACPVGMGLMMWFMAKGMRKDKPSSAEESGEIGDLRAEHERIGAEIERREHERIRNGSHARTKAPR